MNTLKGACIIGQSGGPTSVINASAYGAIKTALECSDITAVYGALNGIKGVLNDNLIDMSKEDPEELALMKTTPSSALCSCRYKLKDPDVDDTDYKRILEIFKKYNVRYFFYNGGNDSMDTCNKISKFMLKNGYECRVMGIPKTIDNDLAGTDHCPGYASAAKYIATSLMEIYHDARVYDTGMITIVEIMGSFIKVFAMILVLHWVIIVFQYTVAGSAAKKNPFALIKNMLPAYTTAIGTQSSAATIPVTTQCTKNNGVSDGMAEFVCPLCATIHLSGSTITLTSCAMAVMVMTNQSIGFGKMFPFILMLGVTMVAAPGVPGGAVMAALGILQSMLGFDETMCGLMIALYIAQDSFGTACNVTGDGAIAVFMDAITGKKKAAAK